MARRAGSGIKYYPMDSECTFPEWSPNRYTTSVLGNNPRYLFYKEDVLKYKWILRNTSSAFISRKDVREYIFKRDDYRCCYCGSANNLHVDHIVSVAACFAGEISLDILNTKDNLQTLCRSCNCAKIP